MDYLENPGQIPGDAQRSRVVVPRVVLVCVPPWTNWKSEPCLISRYGVDANQPRELIEFTPEGQFVGELSLDAALGAAFQNVVQSTRKTVTIASVNDDLATLDFRTIARS